MSDDRTLKQLLTQTKTIAMIGASDDESRDSYGVMRYLKRAGYKVIPVNPKLAGSTLLGERAYKSLADAPGPIQLVDVFRRVEAIPGVVDEVLAVAAEKGIGSLWLQLGLVDEAAAARARSAGLTVVMDRCIKIEHARLIGRG